MSYNRIMFLFLVLSDYAQSISNKSYLEDFTKTLWNLTSLALQSRQSNTNYPHRNPYTSLQNYPSHYAPDYFGNEINNHPQYRPPIPHYSTPLGYEEPFNFQKNSQSFMDALFSVAQNDDLQCVPKLLCEVTSGAMSGRQQGLNLPLNMNVESLLMFLSGFNSAQSSPIIHFGKAAILGVSSKGNSRSCTYAYPQCPSDPDKLIQYLNNHNGGFFRFFQGLNPPQQHYQQNYAHNYGFRPSYYGKKLLAEERIQNRPENNYLNYYGQDPDKDDLGTRGFKFPLTSISTGVISDEKIVFPSNGKTIYKDLKSLTFPLENNVFFRKGKKLHGSYIKQYEDNFLDIQRPLPNHVPSPNIFPDRTGTGELKLDIDDLEQNYIKSVNVENIYQGFSDGTSTENYDQTYFSFPNY